MSENKDHYYKILGLEPGASREEVKEAYRDLVKVWHPDRFAHDSHLQGKAQDKLKEINEAYQVLSEGAARQIKISPQETKSYNAEPQVNGSNAKTYDTLRTSDTTITWLVMSAIAAVVIIMIGVIVGNVSQKDRIEVKSLRDSEFKLPSASNLLGSSRSQDSRGDMPSRYFTIGSTKKDVLDIQGIPTAVMDPIWTYGDSTVTFSASGRVVGYVNTSRNLFIWYRPKGEVSAALSRGCFSIGSTKDEVLAVQGIPTAVLDHVWMYGNSSVTFSRNGRVVGYINLAGNLKINKEKSNNRRSWKISQ